MDLARPHDVIKLTQKDVEVCWEFAETAWSNRSQSQRQFGSEEELTRNAFLADQVEGKLTEIAMQKFLARFGLNVELDFTHYLDPHELDDGDIKTVELNGKREKPGIRLDVKGTSQAARWLFIEEHKYTSDLYLLIRFLDFPSKKEVRENPAALRGRTFHAEVVGWAAKDDFRCPETGQFWFVYKRGERPLHPDCLPKKKPSSKEELIRHLRTQGQAFMHIHLDAPTNYGLPDSWLRDDWQYLVNLIRQSVVGLKSPRGSLAAPPDSKPVVVLPARSALAAQLAAVQPRYSLVVLAGNEPISADAVTEIKRHLRSGIKVYVAADALSPTSEMEPYLEARLLQLFRPSSAECPLPPNPILIVDGRPADEHQARLLEALETDWKPAWPKGRTFNYRQYEVEHANPEEHLSIRAGAGSGKTTVMVQRVLYLLHTVPDLHPSEIVMITFTRDAAHEMRCRLRAALLDRYRLAVDKRERYRNLLEQMGEMQIKTIHAFARTLMLAVGSREGLGRSLNIREFRRERQVILEQIINENVDLNRTIRDQLCVPIYDFLRMADQFWTEMENKGLSLDEIVHMDWGTAEGEAEAVQRILQLLFAEAEKRLKRLKQRTNAISLKDLNRWLDAMRGRVTGLQRHLHSPIRFLFVDEFQDTDDTQIRLVLWLQKELVPRPTLFVVGDVKQSIYRFRGANFTAFEVLSQRAEQQGVFLRSIQLVRNYRTDGALLDDMHPLFAAWSRQGLLVYNPTSDRLIPDKPGGRQIERYVLDKKDDELRDDVIRLIQEGLRTLPVPETDEQDPEQLAVLVRTNEEARKIKDWCESAGIDCQIETGGDFYTSAPVVDFLHLVAALLFPADAAAQLNLYQTPYAQVSVPWQSLVGVDGDPEAIVKELAKFPPMENWADYQESLRLQPVLSVFRRILREANPAQRIFYRRYRDMLAKGMQPNAARAAAEREAIRYSRNLNKLMQILREQFSAESLTLYAIYEFLLLKRATDREEDQAPLTEVEKRARLICKTVHKAKGQEFHTVLIPFTTRRFNWKRTELLLRFDTGSRRWQAGWALQVGSNINSNGRLTNALYKKFESDEAAEVRREETRLLYVAMTRAKKRLQVIIHPRLTNCWSELLRCN